MRKDFYVYLHKRISNGNPFYVGKGSGIRMLSGKSRSKAWYAIVEEESGILYEKVAENLTEQEALKLEKQLIAKHGRVINNSGILCNAKVGDSQSEIFTTEEKKNSWIYGSTEEKYNVERETRSMALKNSNIQKQGGKVGWY